MIYDQYVKTISSSDNIAKSLFYKEINPIESLTTNTFSGRNTEKRDNVNSNLKKEISRKFEISTFESYNLNFMNIESSLKPRKGDKTPRSNFSQSNEVDKEEKEVKKEINFNDLENLNTDYNNDNLELEKHDSNSKDIYTSYNNKNMLLSVNSSSLENKRRNVSMEHPGSRSQMISNHDSSKLRKDLFKSNVLINKNSHFIERMLFDTFKRQTKEERLKSILNDKKQRKNESEIASTFNRLIQDANRRNEASHNLESVKEILNRDNSKTKNKKFKEKEWEKYYSDSVKKFSENRDKKIKEKQHQKELLEKEKEEKILKDLKVVKVPKKEIEQIFQKIYERSTLSKTHFEINRKKSTIKSEKISKFTLSPSSQSKNYSKKKSFLIQNNIISPLFSKEDQIKKQVFTQKENKNILKPKNKNNYGSLQSLKKNINLKDKRHFPLSYRNQNSLKINLPEDLTIELKTESSLPQSEMIYLKDCKEIKKKKTSIKTPKHINDMQALKLVNNIFQKKNLELKN